MHITVQRTDFTDESTIGELEIDGEFFCYTLEPRSNRDKGKPYCIPAGIYRLERLVSVRFGMQTPHVEDVPGFEDIELHPGNSPLDTHGCTLVGFTKAANWVGTSREAFKQLMFELKLPCIIQYIGGPPQ